MLTYSFNNRNKKSLYEYLYTCIKDDIISGKLTPDTKLPSKRDFAKNHGISVVTVENATDSFLQKATYIHFLRRDFMYRRLIIITIPQVIILLRIPLSIIFQAVTSLTM